MSHKTRLCILLIIIGACICYASSIRNTFVYDDFMVLVNSHYIRTIGNLPRLFGHDYFLVSAERTFRPLGPMILFIEYALFGYHPAGYHAANLLIHTANALLLFCLLRLLACSRRCSFAAALCFVLHPAISETVFCVSYLEDLWGFLFYLLALIGFVRFRQTGRIPYVILLHSCFFLSLLSKEMGATILIIIPMLDRLWYGSQSRSLRSLLYAIIPACILLAVYMYMRFFWLYLPEKQASYPGGSLLVTLMNMPRVFFYYVRLCFLPVGLTADYEFPVHAGLTLDAAVSFLWCALTVWLWIKAPRKARFFMLWFVANFLPVSNIIPFGAIVAERYLYFPLAGFAALAGMCVDYLYDIWMNRRSSIHRIVRSVHPVPILVIIAVSYNVLILARAPAWYSDEALWLATIRYSPRKFIQKATFFVNLGNVYYRKNDLDNALKAYKYALKLDPAIAGIRNNTGVIYMEKGYLDMAKSEFLAAIAMSESFIDPYLSLAKLYIRRNQLQQAKEAADKALDIAPGSIQAHQAMVVICSEMGDIDCALTHAYHLLELDPFNEFAYYNATVLYIRRGRIDLAEHIVNQGIRMLPGSKELKRAYEELRKALPYSP